MSTVLGHPDRFGQDSTTDLIWRRERGNWLLLHKRRRMGRVVPDTKHPGMYRIAMSGGRLSDMANLSWAKSLTLDAAERDLAYEVANTPPKTQQKGVFFGVKPRWCVKIGGPQGDPPNAPLARPGGSAGIL